MRDAFGGTFMIKVMLIFFVIFICFMTVAINFAKTFRIKNNVITILEKTNTMDITKDENKDINQKIESYLQKIAYSYGNNKYIKDDCSKRKGINVNGVCIVKKGTETERYYQVISYVVIESPLFDVSTALPVSGETKTIYEQ